MTILGIDPGTRRIGYGVITGKRDSKFIDAGLLKVSAKSDPKALVQIKKDLVQLLKKHKPDCVAVEKVFFSKNKKTAIAVAQARGVILATCFEFDVSIKEYAPTKIKSSITGNGSADKRAVAKMVRLILSEPELDVIDDASDALAIALVAAQEI